MQLFLAELCAKFVFRYVKLCDGLTRFTFFREGEQRATQMWVNSMITRERAQGAIGLS